MCYSVHNWIIKKPCKNSDIKVYNSFMVLSLYQIWSFSEKQVRFILQGQNKEGPREQKHYGLISKQWDERVTLKSIYPQNELEMFKKRKKLQELFET